MSEFSEFDCWKFLSYDDHDFQALFLFASPDVVRIVISKTDTFPYTELWLCCFFLAIAALSYVSAFTTPIAIGLVAVVLCLVHFLSVAMGCELLATRGLGLQINTYSRLDYLLNLLRPSPSSATRKASDPSLPVSARPHIPAGRIEFYAADTLRGPFMHEGFYRWQATFMLAFGVAGQDTLLIPLQPPLLPRLAILHPLLLVLRGVLDGKGSISTALAAAAAHEGADSTAPLENSSLSTAHCHPSNMDPKRLVWQPPSLNTPPEPSEEPATHPQ